MVDRYVSRRAGIDCFLSRADVGSDRRSGSEDVLASGSNSEAQQAELTSPLQSHFSRRFHQSQKTIPVHIQTLALTMTLPSPTYCLGVDPHTWQQSRPWSLRARADMQEQCQKVSSQDRILNDSFQVQLIIIGSHATCASPRDDSLVLMLTVYRCQQAVLAPPMLYTLP